MPGVADTAIVGTIVPVPLMVTARTADVPVHPVVLVTSTRILPAADTVYEEEVAPGMLMPPSCH